MKINWGTGIVIVIVVMVLFMATLVFVATRQDFHLVDENYYEQGIRYQEQIDKRRNASLLKESINFNLTDAGLEVVFPPELGGGKIEGAFHFYYPSDKSGDFQTEINPDEKLKQNIDISRLRKGRYIVKMEWKKGDKGYYQEQQIIIP